MPNVTHKFQEELASGNKKENVKKRRADSEYLKSLQVA